MNGLWFVILYEAASSMRLLAHQRAKFIGLVEVDDQ